MNRRARHLEPSPRHERGLVGKTVVVTVTAWVTLVLIGVTLTLGYAAYQYLDRPAPVAVAAVDRSAPARATAASTSDPAKAASDWELRKRVTNQLESNIAPNEADVVAYLLLISEDQRVGLVSSDYVQATAQKIKRLVFEETK